MLHIGYIEVMLTCIFCVIILHVYHHLPPFHAEYIKYNLSINLLPHPRCLSVHLQKLQIKNNFDFDLTDPCLCNETQHWPSGKTTRYKLYPLHVCCTADWRNVVWKVLTINYYDPTELWELNPHYHASSVYCTRFTCKNMS